MFYFFSKTLNIFIFPSTWIVVLLLISISSKRFRKRLLIITTAFFLVYGNKAISNYLMQMWEWKVVPLDSIEKYDLAIVLTGIVNETKDNERIFFNKGADRIVQAFQLWKLGKVKKILITGGKGGIIEKGNEVEESIKLKSYLVMHEMPDSLIITETRAKNTHENALNTKLLLNHLNYSPQKILLITSAFHMRRALACFRKQNINPDPFPVDYYSVRELYIEDFIPYPNTDAMVKFDILIKEWVGFVVYRLTGRL